MESKGQLEFGNFAVGMGVGGVVQRGVGTGCLLWQVLYSGYL